MENIKSSALGLSQSTAEKIFTCNDVKILQIKADGSVTSHIIEPELTIVKITGINTFVEPIHITILHVLIYFIDNRDHTYSMKAGEFVYPLIPGVSPCYRTKFKAFIFPDLFSNIPGKLINNLRKISSYK